MSPDPEPLLRLAGVSKSFGTLAALQGITLEIPAGQVVGLAGRSGAGKSVLAMLLAGLYPPDEGELFFAGRRLRWPFNARALGIETIHQTPELVETLDVCSNIFTGNEILLPRITRQGIIFPQRRMEARAREIVSDLGHFVGSVRERVTNLSSEQRQLAAIARAMVRPATLMIVDDPMPLLNYPYQRQLLSLIERWQQAGVAVIFSSQNLDHLFAVTDRLLVLRDGRLAADRRTDETTREEVVNTMVGTVERQQLTPIIWALDSYYRARENAEKLQHNEMLLTQDLAARDAQNRQLMDQLNAQVRALDSANLALQDAQRRLLTEREEEHKHLARELHDEMIQDLLSINYQIEQIEADQLEDCGIRTELSAIRTDIRSMIDNLRHICSNLRPPTIDSLGLGAAVKSFADDWGRRTGITVTLAQEANLDHLPEDIALSVFRIIQESLYNVRKHARATAVQIRFKDLSPRMLMIAVSDNGRGLAHDFDLSALSAESHYGLLGISERVALLGGRLSFQNQGGGGLLIRVEIPHPRLLPAE